MDIGQKKDFESTAIKYAHDKRYLAKESVIVRAYLRGCEYGYQYAVDKACEWLQIRMLSENTIEQFKQFMED